MNVLSIGNSFSQDAQKYLHGIARADGVTLDCFNLYIGGCTLERHFRNMMSDKREYCLEMNGQSTGFYVSIKEALLTRSWDVVTVQQASHQSTRFDNYTPYIEKLAAYIRELCPKAKIAVHKTWAYEQGSERIEKIFGYTDQRMMFDELDAAYNRAAEVIGADIMIPSGDVFQSLIAAGFEKIHRDTFHASYGVGRYALGLTWYAVLTGKGVTDNSFCDFAEPISADDILTVKRCVMETIKR